MAWCLFSFPIPEVRALRSREEIDLPEDTEQRGTALGQEFSVPDLSVLSPLGLGVGAASCLYEGQCLPESDSLSGDAHGFSLRFTFLSAFRLAEVLWGD